MVAACYAVWNEAGEITDSIRSVKAYVDRFIIVDCAYTANPTPGPVQSTDGTREVIEAAIDGDVPLTYIEPKKRLEQHVARNLYVQAVGQGGWFLVMDGDEILVGDHRSLKSIFRHPPSHAVAFRIYSQAVLYPGKAPDVPEEKYGVLPVISSVGWQPRIFRNINGLEHRAGYESVGWRSKSENPIKGFRSWDGIVINRHVAQDYDGYLADYSWGIRHRTKPTREGEYAEWNP